MTDAALTHDFLHSALRHASDQLRALAAIALDPDVPAADQALARDAVVQHLSGTHPAVAVHAGDRHLALERDLLALGAANRKREAHLCTAIVRALPRTAPAPAVSLPGRWSAVLLIALAGGTALAMVAALPRFLPLTAATAVVLVGVIAASCRRRDLVAHLRPSHLVLAASALGSIALFTSFAAQAAPLMEITTFAWAAFIGGLVGLAVSWSPLAGAGRALVLRALAATCMIAGHGLLGL